MKFSLYYLSIILATLPSCRDDDEQNEVACHGNSCSNFSFTIGGNYAERYEATSQYDYDMYGNHAEIVKTGTCYFKSSKSYNYTETIDYKTCEYSVLVEHVGSCEKK